MNFIIDQILSNLTVSAGEEVVVASSSVPSTIYISLIIMHNSERDIIDLKTPVVHTLAYIESHIQQHGEEEAEVVEGVEAGRQL